VRLRRNYSEPEMMLPNNWRRSLTSLGKEMRFVPKRLVPFWCAFVICPACILFHELGHCLAGACLGFSVQLHYAKTTLTIPNEKDTPPVAIFHAGAGPLVTAILAVVGLLWLHGLRRHRREARPTPTDWLATSLVLNAGRWVVSVIRPRHDEVLVSQTLGMPGWLLPCLLGVLAFIPLVAAIRLHPPGARLLPFSSLLLGGGTGVLLWMRLLGPLLLP